MIRATERRCWAGRGPRRIAGNARWGIAALSLLAAACDDPFSFDWAQLAPDTVSIYSLSRPEHLGRPSVVDFVFGGTFAIEADVIGNWDLTYVDAGSVHRFMLPGATTGWRPQSIIRAMPGYTFDAVTRAPSSGYDSTGVAIRPGIVYVLRTREVSDGSGNSCRYTVKLEPFQIDSVTGRLHFRYLRNPNCGSLDLSGRG